MSSLTDVNGDNEDDYLPNDGISTEECVISRQEREASKHFSSLFQMGLGVLNERQRQILHWRYLVPESQIKTFDILSKEFGVTQGRVCQLHREALTKMGRYLQSHFQNEVAEELHKLRAL